MTTATLSYDELPEGSDIRRVLEPGSVHITVPAGEPPRSVRKQAALDGLVSGALFSVPLLLLACVVFYMGIRANRVSGVMLTWAWAMFAIFCATMVLLISWVLFGVITDALRAGRLQSTVIAATSDRVLIETTGPFGAAGYDLPRANIRRIICGRGVMHDHRGHGRHVHRLEVMLTDGRKIALLPGRDPRELRWVSGTIAQIMRIQAA